MPPKKTKGANAEEKAVLDYICKTNRPYSANDISSQLHGLVSPAQAKKILNDLADEGKINRKANGKQQIFYAIQNEADIPNVEDAEEEEELVKELEDRLATLKDSTKSLAGRLHGLTSALTDDQMRERIAALSLEIRQNEEHLEDLRSGEVISPQEKKKIDSEHAAMIKLWATRKRIFKSIVEAVREGYPGNINTLLEELGVETDESAGADVAILGSR
ncbi:PSMC3 interacting protein [Coemansia sp. Benny D115]|nr:PSMC3 interacting protein [Coemansia sp. Benny D115]